MKMTDPLEASLRAIHAGRLYLCVGGVLQECEALANLAMKYGAAGCFLIAGRNGTGALPTAFDYVELGLEAKGMMQVIHGVQDLLLDLPEDVLAKIEAFDPTGRALVLAPFFMRGDPVASRAFYAPRPASWQALEDKTVIDTVLAQAGIQTAPSRTLPVEWGRLQQAHEALDEGLGTVIAADCRQGFNGGAKGLRWIRGLQVLQEDVDFFAGISDQVRVQPFLEGIPCSIHGINFPDGVAVFRPNEMVILRCRQDPGLLYSKFSTCWDPTDAGRRQMRDAARKLGEYLMKTLGYQGAFSIDGIMTDRGFLPTEVNPRVGAALGQMGNAPFTLLSYALIAGEEVQVSAADFESEMLAYADTHREGRLGCELEDIQLTQSASVLLRHDGQGFCATLDEEEAWGTLHYGPGSAGGYMVLRLKPSKLPIGQSLGPFGVDLLTWSRAHLGTKLGPATAARDLRGFVEERGP